MSVNYKRKVKSKMKMKKFNSSLVFKAKRNFLINSYNKNKTNTKITSTSTTTMTIYYYINNYLLKTYRANKK